jgi:hypothetical protein
MKREVVQLGAGAVVAYREAGWAITASGRPHLGMFTGPCARCSDTTVLYGPLGQPLCPACRPGTEGAPEQGDN